MRGMSMGRVVLGVGLALVVAMGAGSCIVADPAPTLPVVPTEPPNIELGSVVPVPGIITEWPDLSTGFEIPVYVTDSSQTLQWLAYLDYDPVFPSPTVPPVQVPSADGNAVRVVHAVIGEPIGSGCHTVEVVIASAFEFATPASPGGAVVTWTYVPSGDPGQCAPYLYDAGPPDGGADAAKRDGAASRRVR
jgi:hypothetical protein